MLRGQISILLWTFQMAYRPDGYRGPEGIQGLYRSRGYLTAKEFEELVRWKMYGRESFAQPIIDAGADKAESGTARLADAIKRGASPAELVRLADEAIPGIKISMASTILATWSDEYPIFDPRAWRALERMTCNPYFGGNFRRDGYERYGEYVEIVRGVAASIKATPRNVDKALYIIGRGRP
jgi:hypothetical protein